MYFNNFKPILVAIIFLPLFMGIAAPSTYSSKFLTIHCKVHPGAAISSVFVTDFCKALGSGIAKIRTATAKNLLIEVQLNRTSQYQLTAQIHVRTAGGQSRDQQFTMSTRDSYLQPSIANTLIFPILQLLD